MSPKNIAFEHDIRALAYSKSLFSYLYHCRNDINTVKNIVGIDISTLYHFHSLFSIFSAYC